MRILVFFLIGLILASCSSTPNQVPTVIEQPTPTPTPAMGKELSLWSTYYMAPVHKSSTFGEYLRDINGNSLGVKVPLKDLCEIMLEGGGFVDGTAYTWAGNTSTNAVDCSRYYSKGLVSGKLKFKKDTALRGVKNFELTPFKSIAVDPSVIAYGTKLFIPDLKGIQYNYDGKVFIHDGIVTAVDTGGAIKGNHIDFYIGPVDGGASDAGPIIKPFLGVIKSTKTGTFTAYIVE